MENGDECIAYNKCRMGKILIVDSYLN